MDIDFSSLPIKEECEYHFTNIAQNEAMIYLSQRSKSSKQITETDESIYKIKIIVEKKMTSISINVEGIDDEILKDNITKKLYTLAPDYVRDIVVVNIDLIKDQITPEIVSMIGGMLL